MAVKNSVQALELRSFNVAGLLAGFQTVYTPGLDHPCFMLRFINDSNTDVIVSYDGVIDHEYVLLGTDLTLSFQTNSQPNNKAALMAKGTQIYVRGAAGVGSFIVVGYFQAVT